MDEHRFADAELPVMRRAARYLTRTEYFTMGSLPHPTPLEHRGVPTLTEATAAFHRLTPHGDSL